jgi:hypothetical protein
LQMYYIFKIRSNIYGIYFHVKKDKFGKAIGF